VPPGRRIEVARCRAGPSPTSSFCSARGSCGCSRMVHLKSWHLRGWDSERASVFFTWPGGGRPSLFDHLRGRLGSGQILARCNDTGDISCRTVLASAIIGVISPAG
jgi:hypothetical protein